MCVSILVFLELALGHGNRIDIDHGLLVSILVFLELALGPTGAKGPKCQVFWFQSLFSWNLPSDIRFEDHSPPTSVVSILVFLELALGPPPFFTMSSPA